MADGELTLRLEVDDGAWRSGRPEGAGRRSRAAYALPPPDHPAEVIEQQLMTIGP